MSSGDLGEMEVLLRGEADGQEGMPANPDFAERGSCPLHVAAMEDKSVPSTTHSSLFWILTSLLLSVWRPHSFCSRTARTLRRRRPKATPPSKSRSSWVPSGSRLSCSLCNETSFARHVEEASAATSCPSCQHHLHSRRRANPASASSSCPPDPDRLLLASSSLPCRPLPALARP